VLQGLFAEVWERLQPRATPWGVLQGIRVLIHIYHGATAICSPVYDDAYLEEVLQSWAASQQQDVVVCQFGWQQQLAEAET
jgi:hypothetical protein